MPSIEQKLATKTLEKIKLEAQTIKEDLTLELRQLLDSNFTFDQEADVTFSIDTKSKVEQVIVPKHNRQEWHLQFYDKLFGATNFTSQVWSQEFIDNMAEYVTAIVEEKLKGIIDLVQLHITNTVGDVVVGVRTMLKTTLACLDFCKDAQKTIQQAKDLLAINDTLQSKLTEISNQLSNLKTRIAIPE